MLYYLLIVLAFLINRTLTLCPSTNILSPCKCTDDVIYCEGNELDLSKIFHSLSASQYQKHYKGFQLYYTDIKSLNENTFDRITFEYINICCSDLTSIDRNAFTETTLITDKVYITNNPLLSSPDNSIFEVLSKFKNASDIQLSYNNIHVIPPYAFKPIIGYQDRLKYLTLSGEDYEEIGENAFYYLNSLTQLEMQNTNIDFIPTNAFAFRDISNNSLILDITLNKFFRNYNISQKAFLHFNRPVVLKIISYYNEYNIKYLEEKIFLPFLLKNPMNKIITKQILDCEDCRNSWLNDSTIIQNRIDQLKCSNNKTINDPSNFKNCTLK